MSESKLAMWHRESKGNYRHPQIDKRRCPKGGWHSWYEAVGDGFVYDDCDTICTRTSLAQLICDKCSWNEVGNKRYLNLNTFRGTGRG